MESINARKIQLNHWLQTICAHEPFSLQPLAGDASFRRYYRLKPATGSSFIVMDAPPPQENCAPFVAVALALRQLGLQAPEIFSADIEQGFLLLTDFGDLTYLQALNNENADHLYTNALNALGILQRCRVTAPGKELLPFDRAFMMQEWAWHQEWFLEKLLNLKPVSADVTACYIKLVDTAVMQPQVFMHRDYHSANLMVLSDDQVGILDFQDAFIGPVTYDVASLLRDSYIEWPVQRVYTWVKHYWELLHSMPDFPRCTYAEFERWFDFMGMQRNLKALLTFARKQVRDHQPNYLQHIPRTLNYIIDVSQKYPELAALHTYLLTTVTPALTKVPTLCEP